MEYVYKIKHKFTKQRQNNFREIENYGFSFYKDEEGKEEIYAISISLSVENDIVQNAKRIIEYFYSNATEEQRKQDFEGWDFSDNKIVMNEQSIKNLTQTQLCFCLKGKTANTLFINGTDGKEYYNSEILRESIGELIKYLLDNKIIYKAKTNFQWRKVYK